MKRYTIFLCSFLLILAMPLIGQTKREIKDVGNYSNFTNTLEASTISDVSIRFYDKTIYYPDAVNDNPIYIKITIANKTSNTIRFKLADDRIFSMDFITVTSKNIQLNHTEYFIKKRSQNQPVFFREISLEPGEEYSFIENLKQYIKITDPGIYYLEGFFYPELNRIPQETSETTKVSSVPTNRLSLEIRPNPGAASLGILPIDQQTKDILKRKEISPDEVITQTINALQRSSWDEYFLYIDLEEMITNDSSRSRKFRAESADGRTRMIEYFKNDVINKTTDSDIVRIPQRFEIEQTSYTQTTGTVSVLEYFEHPTFVERKRYTYTLHKRDGIWLIVNYDVTNLESE